MSKVWHKVIPPKKAQEIANIYHGVWMPQLDRAWESEDGYSVMSRAIKTAWGVVEHVTIQNMIGVGDVPWAVKQGIKDDLFGYKCTAIEVFPAKKNLIDVRDVYHLWVLPKDFKMPFGIHPYRDVQCDPVERGYDFNIDDCGAWNESETRNAIMKERSKHMSDEDNACVEANKRLIENAK